VDEREEAAILEVLRAKEFSRYAGGATADVESVLRLTSAEAMTHPLNYFNFLGGERVRRFEADCAAAFSVPYAVAVNSATTGLSLALAASCVGPGDEVIVPCMSFTATASAILMFGSIPVFVDVDPQTFCMNPDAVRAALSPRTRAILVVHLLGNAANMDALISIAREHGLAVIEDCAQAPGVKYRGRPVGAIGDAGILSFQETKNVMTGEGGMILTRSPEIARKCRLIRNHGEVVADETYPQDDLIVGFNFRMTELTAALGVEQLKRLPANNAARNRNAQYLHKHLEGLPGLTMPYVLPEVDYQCHVFGMLYDEQVTGVSRTVLVKALREEGIPVGTGYVRLLYEHPIFLKKSAFGETGFPFCPPWSDGKVRYERGMCPIGEELIYKKFLWVYQVAPPATETDMQDIVRAFEKVYASMDRLRAVSPDGVVLDYRR
jgi:dTDP-4-amino-4,6-dideoxygalactose transaminase